MISRPRRPRPALDEVAPEAWEAAQQFSAAITRAVHARGLTSAEAELIKVRASQLNGCEFCLDLHSRQARRTGVAQQRLDLLPAWRESDLYSREEEAVLAIAEAVTVLPLTEDGRADLVAAHAVLGEQRFVAAEWVAATINVFNRISICSSHRVRPRDDSGKVLR